jgi:alpha-tubulin suppressor-like RCC1 family protein
MRSRSLLRPRGKLRWLSVVAVLVVSSATGASALFGNAPTTTAALATASLTGTHAPAAGTSTFTGEPATLSCDLAWSALSGGTAVADRYEITDSTGAAVVTPGNVGVGAATVPQRPLTQRYTLRTRAAVHWQSATIDSRTVGCSLGELVSYSVGFDATCGIKSDGTLWCWGFAALSWLTADATEVTRSTPNQVGTATNWRQVSVGGDVACATRSDDSGWCWGNNWSGAIGDGTYGGLRSPTQVAGSWSRIAAGGYHACGLRTDSTLWCWGGGWSGQLGLGSPTQSATAVQVGTDTWLHVDIGDAHTCAIRSDHALFCWGANWNAQVGNGSYADVQSPLQIAGSWSGVSLSRLGTCGVRTDGSAWCWGWAGWGQTTQTAVNDSTTPYRVGTANDWARVATGFYASCGVKTTGTPWCWGTNAYGATAQGTSGWSIATVPQQVGSLTSWTDVDGYSLHLCGLRSGGTLACWGAGGLGTTGQGNTAWRTAAQVGSLTTWSAVATGLEHTCAIRTDSTLWCWGDNHLAQRNDWNGDGQGTPVQVNVGGSTTVKRVAAGDGHTCAIRTDDTLWCWGWNQDGQGGIGNNDWTIGATRVGSPNTYTRVAASRSSTCAVRSDATLWCWGRNDEGQLGDGTTTYRNAPVQVAGSWKDVSLSLFHTCGIKSDDTAWCWGANWYGQLGSGNNAQATSPVAAGANSNVVQITAGVYHSCLRRANDDVYCWGANWYGQLGDGTTSSSNGPVQLDSSNDHLSVGAGSGFTCVRRTTGNMHCVGRNATGAWGIGSVSTTNTSPVQAATSVASFATNGSGHHLCQIRTNGTLWCAGANQREQLGYSENTTSPASVTGTWKT